MPASRRRTSSSCASAARWSRSTPAWTAPRSALDTRTTTVRFCCSSANCDREGPRVLIDPRSDGTIRVRERCWSGPTTSVAELRDLVTGLNLKGAVDFVGTVSDAELPSYYAAADVFVFPTVTTIECLGLTFVQAMFAGTPVVATRIAGAPEVIRDGEDGFLVEPGNAGALADRVRHVLELPRDAREAITSRGRERASELYSEAAILEDLFQAYDRLL